MNIQWKKTEYGTLTGTDELGNKFWTPANRETCDVETIDGLTAHGWTPEEALQNAASKMGSH